MAGAVTAQNLMICTAVVPAKRGTMRRMKTRRRSLLSLPMLTLLLTLVGCGGGRASAAAADLESARQRWTQLGWTSYRYTLTQGCFCLPEGPLQITVQGGVVVSAIDTGVLGGQPVSAQRLAQLLTIDGFFDLVGRAQRDAASVTVNFDPAQGFPVTLYIDWIAQVADDEVSYRISAVEAF